jgi:hypothetical protein
MFTAAAADAKCCKSGYCMRCRFERTLIYIASTFMTRSAEFFFTVACLAFHRFALCSNAVCESEI